jgi:hypothetical protein
MMFVWHLATIRKWGFWCALAAFTGLGVCLVHTVSRGGVVMLASGGAVLVWGVKPPWNPAKAVAVIASLLFLVTASIYLEIIPRYGEGITEEDASIANRIQIWQCAPRMMVDAPEGWGLGNSGNAYMQWYQPTNRSEVYRTLVNSHLTWLVEVGWPARIIYLFVWSSVLMLCWPRDRKISDLIPLAVWISFFVGALFSSIAESVYLWAIPGFCLFTVLLRRRHDGKWPKAMSWSLPLAISLLVLGIFALLGSIRNDWLVHGSPREVILGDRNPKTWVLVDRKILGSDFGRTLRRNNPSCSVGMITSASVPQSLAGTVLIVCGTPTKNELDQLPVIAGHFQKVLFVNPDIYPIQCKFYVSIPTSVIYGEFSESPSLDSWKRSVKDVRILSGVGDFIPNWPHLLLD